MTIVFERINLMVFSSSITDIIQCVTVVFCRKTLFSGKKSMRKKFICFAIVSVALTILSACDGSDNTTSSPAELESVPSEFSTSLDDVVVDSNGNIVILPDTTLDSNVIVDTIPVIVDTISNTADIITNPAGSESSSSLFNNPSVNYGSLVDDRDGQVYKTVVIGKQTWMAQNLNYETDDSYCYYDDANNCAKYGRLYTWAAAMDSAGEWSANGEGCGYKSECSPIYPVRGVCPKGWYLPSDDEWYTLLKSIGFVSKGESKFFSEGADDFGFSALPAGYRDSVAFNINYGFTYYGLGDVAAFWNSTGYGQYAYHLTLRFSEDLRMAYFSGFEKYYGHSVRCLKDDGKTIGSSSSNAKSSSSQKAELSSNISSELVDGILIDHRNEQSYKTVAIGTQIWMAENLNYETANSYCYDDDANNCVKYGRLYTWAAAVGKSENECGFGYTCSLPLGNVQGACPSGWHLPSKDEWNVLFAVVGDSTVAGRILKSVSEWPEGGNGTDIFKFSALPVGFRHENGPYSSEGDGTLFWSSTENLSSYAYILGLIYSIDYVVLDEYTNKGRAGSIRCLKD